MSFHSPWLLLFLLLIPGAVYLRYARNRQSSALFSTTTGLHSLPKSWRVRTLWIPPALFTLGLVVAVIGLARPREGLEESRIKTDVVDIVMLIDVSTSMEAEDFSMPGRRMNRLDASKAVIEEFINRRKGDRMSLVAFAALPYTVSPLTLDHEWLKKNMERIKIGMLEDGTAIGTALASAVNRLKDSEASSKVVVLLTDGVNNAGSLSPENAALAAEALGITVYSIGAASDSPPPRQLGIFRMAQRVEIDEETLKTIASTTGGKYFRAQDFRGLQEVYREIDELEKTEIEVEQFKRFEEHFKGWVLAALLFFVLESVLSSTLYRRGLA